MKNSDGVPDRPSKYLEWLDFACKNRLRDSTGQPKVFEYAGPEPGKYLVVRFEPGEIVAYYPRDWEIDGRGEQLGHAYDLLCDACSCFEGPSGGSVRLRINSAYRTLSYDRAVGGVSGQHVRGRALDLATPEGWTLLNFHSTCWRVAQNPESGIGGIGFYSWGVHIDVRPKVGDGRIARWGTDPFAKHPEAGQQTDVPVRGEARASEPASDGVSMSEITVRQMYKAAAMVALGDHKAVPARGIAWLVEHAQMVADALLAKDARRAWWRNLLYTVGDWWGLPATPWLDGTYRNEYLGIPSELPVEAQKPVTAEVAKPNPTPLGRFTAEHLPTEDGWYWYRHGVSRRVWAVERSPAMSTVTLLMRGGVMLGPIPMPDAGDFDEAKG